MNLFFWSIILFLTAIAWIFIVLPFWRAPTRTGSWTKVGLLSFPFLVLGMYLLWGGSRQLLHFWAWQKQDQIVQQQTAHADPQQIIAQLQAHLQQAPDSAQGWYLLGKLYLDQQQFAEAESALKKAYDLQPQANEIIISLAKADFFNHQAHLSADMAKALSRVLESSPQSIDAINLLAVNAYRDKNYSQAVSYWQQALAFVQPGSSDSKTLLNMISQAQKLENKEKTNGRIH